MLSYKLFVDCTYKMVVKKNFFQKEEYLNHYRIYYNIKLKYIYKIN